MTLAIGASPGKRQSRRQSKRRAAPASSKPAAHNGSGVPCSAVSPAAATGAPGEQKHLPDRPTPSQLSRKDWINEVPFRKDMNHAVQRKSTSPGAFAAKPVGDASTNRRRG